MTTVTALVDQSDYVAILAALAAAQEEARAAKSWLDIANALNQRMEIEFTQRVAAAQADAALWRQRVLGTREILNLVEDVSDKPTPENVQALVDAFDAWRMLVERDVPTMWTVAEDDAGDEPDETEPPF